MQAQIKLLPSTTYSFRICAYNTIGDSPYVYFNSTTKDLTTPTAPPAPFYLQYTRSTIDVSWSSPADDGGMKIDNYTLVMSTNSSSWNFLTTTSDMRYQVTSLETQTVYYFKVEATNVIGTSPWSVVANLTTAPVLCGDGICDASFGENCSNCFLDCGSCGYPTCKGTPECSGHGECEKGVCDCDNGWYGDICNTQDQVPITVIVNNTSPTIGIGLGNGTDSQDSGNVSFSISFDTIREVDVNGDIIESYDLSKQNFTVTPNLNDTSGAAASYIYQIMLPNKATLDIYIQLFTNATTVQFANQTIKVPSNGLKYSMKVASWPFHNIRNMLQISIKSDVQSENGNDCKTTDISEDGSNNIQWIKIQLNGVALYGTFSEYAVLDTAIRTVQFLYNSTTGDVIIQTPHFFDEVELDPNFQVLLDPSQLQTSCDGAVRSSTNVAAPVIGGVIGGVVGAACLICGGMLLVRRKRQKKTMRRLSTGPKKEKSNKFGFKKNATPSSSPLYNDIERQNPLYRDDDNDQL